MLLLIAVFGCGTKDDDDDDRRGGGGGRPGDDVDACDSDACGGDPTGTWTVSSPCWYDGPIPFDSFDCQGGYSQITELDTTGTVIFAEDGSYDIDLGTTTGAAEATVPSECLRGLECSEIADAVGDEATCTEDREGGCSCATDYNAGPSSASGRWTLRGEDLELDGESWSFCADADEMWLAWGDTIVTSLYLRR